MATIITSILSAIGLAALVVVSGCVIVRYVRSELGQIVLLIAVSGGVVWLAVAGSQDGDPSCETAIYLSEERYQLSESSRSLTEDALRAEEGFSEEYALAGVDENDQRVSELGEEYADARDECLEN